MCAGACGCVLSGNSKSVYFTRTNTAKSVDLKTVDSDLLCGETMGMPLESLQSLITHVYRPLIGAQEEWRNCTEEPVAPASSFPCALSSVEGPDQSGVYYCLT